MLLDYILTRIKTSEFETIMIPAIEIKPLFILIASAGASLIWLLGLIVYRLYLSPIAKFPGPKIAALTHWYECYYDVFTPGGGMYMWEVEKMHKKYGRCHYHSDSWQWKTG
jgi:hypothetical protein